MPDSNEFATARDRVGAWKPDPVMRFQRSLIHHALGRTDPTFTVDIVPDSDRDGSQSVGGCSTRVLISANVIEPVLLGSDLTGWAQATRKRERPERNGARVNLYRLTNRGIAREWLRRNGGYTRAGVNEQCVMEGIA